jgi:hypothetical protein
MAWSRFCSSLSMAWSVMGLFSDAGEPAFA